MIIIATVTQFSDSLQHLAGFLFVMFVLSVLWIVLIISGGIFKTLKHRKTNIKSAPAATPVAATAAASDELPEEDLVLIATAVSLMLGNRPHRLIAIRTPGMDWGREGKRQHLLLNKLR